MFFESEAVRSGLHGLGRVVDCGSNPIVQFVDGPRCRVHGDALRVIPDEDFEMDMANRLMWERYLSVRVGGPVEPSCPIRPQRFDLNSALRNDRLADQFFDEHGRKDGILFFFGDDLNPRPWTTNTKPTNA